MHLQYHWQGTVTLDNARVNDMIGPSITLGSAKTRIAICTPTRPWIDDWNSPALNPVTASFIKIKEFSTTSGLFYHISP